MTLPKTTPKSRRFVANVTHWYETYTPISLDAFYEDLLHINEELLNNEGRRKRNETCHKKWKNYTEDANVKKWNRLLRAAQKKWVQSGRDEYCWKQPKNVAGCETRH